ncbi:hypothetical protein L596_003603 [Steinernema carpocapsae]|uniref:Uncharacterized protein n=1 Tax=Steinernema carpocapsae TaxID=34508 RepID=A0A4U8UT36_STECR|nr:hypothetical protein L596_003603 [Steinernema carpocapsae]
MSDLVARLAYLWVAANCRCVLRRCRSANHLDCLQIEPWVVEQIQECEGYMASKQNQQKQNEKLPNFSESLDSL